MYDWPEIRAATDAFWSALAAALNSRGVAAPRALERSVTSEEILHDAGLVFAQTCGYPLMKRYSAVLAPLAAPTYAVPGCAGGRYASFIVARKGGGIRSLADAPGRRLAVNAANSQSGHNILRFELARAGIAGQPFSAVLVTGAHRKSMRAIAAENADIAAIDAVCFALAARHDPDIVAGLDIVAETVSAPSLPFVSAIDRPPEQLAACLEAFREVLSQPSLAPVREALFLKGAEPARLADYEVILGQEAQANAAGVARFA